MNLQIAAILERHGIETSHADYDKIAAAMAEVIATKAPEFLHEEAFPHSNDGVEQEAFEAYARRQRMNLDRHPLHYVFLDEKTATAREAWRNALYDASQRLQAAFVGLGIKPLCHVKVATTLTDLKGYQVCAEDTPGARAVYHIDKQSFKSVLTPDIK